MRSELTIKRMARKAWSVAYYITYGLPVRRNPGKKEYIYRCVPHVFRYLEVLPSAKPVDSSHDGLGAIL